MHSYVIDATYAIIILMTFCINVTHNLIKNIFDSRTVAQNQGFSLVSQFFRRYYLKGHQKTFLLPRSQETKW
jgi:hypothetical protein